jgi:hypothetical protein
MKTKRAGRVAQALECLPSKCEALSSNPKEKKEKKGGQNRTGKEKERRKHTNLRQLRTRISMVQRQEKCLLNPCNSKKQKQNLCNSVRSHFKEDLGAWLKR